MQFLELSAARMAWCARVERSSGATTVFHGSWVERIPGGFVEGAWSGSFGAGGFAEASIFLGSGACHLESDPLFVTASHPFEPLYSVNDNETICISNSLAFLCVIGGLRPDLKYPFYVYDLTSFTRGLSQIDSMIDLLPDAQVQVHYCVTLRLGPDFELEERRRPVLRAIDSFEDYYEFLSRSTKAIAQNAKSPARERVFSPLATISSGYDSPAAAVFAKEVGATRAVTFGSAREVFGADSDAGDEVGQHLGLEVAEYSRLDYRDREDYPEADFLASGTGGEDVVFASLEEELPGTLLFTGFLGDTVWSRHHPDPNASLDFVMRHPAGASVNEFRIRTGFIHFPVPLTTYTMHPSLHRISNSSEMKPWSIADRHELSWEALLARTGPGYDRPIARRILEDLGVPREAFGQKKRAVSQPFYHDEDLEEIMSTHSFEDFQDFLDRADLAMAPLSLAAHRTAAFVYRILSYPLKILRKVTLYWGRPLDVQLPWPARYTEPLSENLFTFHWALKKVRLRYEEAVRDAM